jgi:hypothetical protein
LDVFDVGGGVGAGGVDDVEEQGGFDDFFEGGAEGGDERGGEAADETDGVAEKDLAAGGKDEMADGGVEGGEHFGVGEDARAGEAIEERALAGVGVTDESHGD